MEPMSRALAPCPCPCPFHNWARAGARAVHGDLSEPVAAVDAAAAAHAIGLAAMVAGGRPFRKRLGTLGAIRLADLIVRLALRTGDLARHAALLQVGLDFASRKIPLVHILGKIDLEQLVEPAVL